MEIEEFVRRSEGNWISMRSSHSLAFKHFEQSISHIKIKLLKENDNDLIQIIEANSHIKGNILSPFIIEWESDSDWSESDSSVATSGSTILIPIPKNQTEGKIFRSSGYIESIQAFSDYEFLSDGSLTLRTKYQHTLAEERIWFVSENCRCRSSITRISKSLGILQASYASETRKNNV